MATVHTYVFCPVLATPQANNLIKAGYKVVVWNRNPAKCEPLKAAGAEVREQRTWGWPVHG